MITTIQNNTGVPQSIVFKGKQIILDASSTGSFDEEVAKKFIESRSPLVSIIEEEPDLFDGGTEMVWIANFTGNEDLSETISVKHWSGGRWSRTDIPNPKREARVIERFMDMGMKSYTAKDGVFEGMNLPKTRFRLPAFTRRAFPKNLANWSLKRDALSDLNGSLVKSRAPTMFEPDESWSLDDARGYLRLIDPSAPVGSSESDVIKKASQDPEAVRAGESGVMAYVTAAKRTVLRRLFFRVADPQYHLPTREEFNEFMRGEVPASRSDADAVMDMLVGSAAEVKKKRKTRSDKGKKRVKADMASATP